jgi:hypothetical protein
LVAVLVNNDNTFVSYNFLGFDQLGKPPPPIVDQAQQNECFVTYGQDFLAPYFPVSCCTVVLHVEHIIPPAAAYNAWCESVNDLGIVADVIPHLEEVNSFVVTSTV